LSGSESKVEIKHTESRDIDQRKFVVPSCHTHSNAHKPPKTFEKYFYIFRNY